MIQSDSNKLAAVIGNWRYDKCELHHWHWPIVEKNDLSPHSATKTKRKVLITVLAAAKIPAPFPENSETASSACMIPKDMKLI